MFPDDMQDDIGVERIAAVSVMIPVRSPLVDFHIAAVERSVEDDGRIEEIRTSRDVPCAWMDDAKGCPVDAGQVLVQIAFIPDDLEEALGESVSCFPGAVAVIDEVAVAGMEPWQIDFVNP